MLATAGLALPLPSIVERIAAALVSGSQRLAFDTAESGPVALKGAIVETADEMMGGQESRFVQTGSWLGAVAAPTAVPETSVATSKEHRGQVGAALPSLEAGAEASGTTPGSGQSVASEALAPESSGSTGAGTAGDSRLGIGQGSGTGSGGQGSGSTGQGQGSGSGGQGSGNGSGKG